jgi:hypothetical protein
VARLPAPPGVSASKDAACSARGHALAVLVLGLGLGLGEVGCVLFAGRGALVSELGGAGWSWELLCFR